MMNLNEYIVRNAQKLRSSQANARRDAISEDSGDVRVVRSLGLDAASVALPAGISLEDRADRMNSFWRTLVEFQFRNVLVVAICADSES
jgi:hypothetical protein